MCQTTAAAFVPRARIEFRLRDGVAVVAGSAKRQALWVDCASCGTPQTPAVLETVTKWRREFFGGSTPYTVLVARELVEVRNDRAYSASGAWAACGTCGVVGHLRTITDRHAVATGARTKCGGACLNGKTTCDCACNGRCHGAGVCYC